jgi:hypothetical protein
MLAISFVALLLFGVPQPSGSVQAEAPPKTSPDNSPADIVVQESAPKAAIPDPASQKQIAELRARNEPRRQAAIRINEMAANIHSEKDARAFVDAVAEELTNHKHLMWAALTYRRRVAHAEYEAVSDPGNLISEQRVADVWNEYVREIDAPEQALISVDEIHRMRVGRYRMSKMLWQREFGQTIWTMPNVMRSATTEPSPGVAVPWRCSMF